MSLVLLLVAALSWIYTNDPALRAAASAALAAALLLPLGMKLARARRLLAAGYGHQDVVTALIEDRGRRGEELSFVYGATPRRFERAVQWLPRVATLAGALSGWLSPGSAGGGAAAAAPGGARP